MRRSGLVLFVFLVLAFSGTAEASDEIWTNYFDCNENLVGWSLRDECMDSYYSSGPQSGAYKHVETMNCNGGTQSYGQWYYWDGSGWVAFSGPPGPNC